MNLGSLEAGERVLDLFDLGGSAGWIAEGTELLPLGEDLTTGEDVDDEGGCDAAPCRCVYECDAEVLPFHLIVLKSASLEKRETRMERRV